MKTEAKQSKATHASNRPTVSVIIPTHNRPWDLARALESVQAQTFSDYEVVVVNDGGEDVSSVVSESGLNARIRLIQLENSCGAGRARNVGLEAARGFYVAYLDDDDLYMPSHLESVVSALKSSGHRFAYTDALQVKVRPLEQGGYERLHSAIFNGWEFNREYLLIVPYFTTPSVVHERSCIEEVGGFDETLSTHEDLDLWIRMALRFDFVRVPHTTVEVRERVSGASLTGANLRKRLENLELVHKRYADAASPQVKLLQRRVLLKMYGQYKLSPPERLLVG